MRDASAGQGEFTEVVPDHFGTDLDLDEGLAVVHGDALADELGEDDHVTAVRAHGAAGRPADAVEERSFSSERPRAMVRRARAGSSSMTDMLSDSSEGQSGISFRSATE